MPLGAILGPTAVIFTRGARRIEGGNGCGNGNGIGDDGGQFWGDGDGNSCSAFGVNGCSCGLGNKVNEDKNNRTNNMTTTGQTTQQPTWRGKKQKIRKKAKS